MVIEQSVDCWVSDAGEEEGHQTTPPPHCIECVVTCKVWNYSFTDYQTSCSNPVGHPYFPFSDLRCVACHVMGLVLGPIPISATAAGHRGAEIVNML